jgi:poly(3-hydroxybutyrate) depolymerase
LPLIKGLAKQADLDGFATVRFDWTFFTEQTKPSEDGSVEMEDLNRIIAMVKANPKLDSTRVYISGKSLGSLLAYAAFRENPWLKGCILLTPVLPSAEAGEDYYPNLTFETRPLAFILGDKDIDNCPLTELYKLISTCATAFPVVALAGGHGFELGYDDKDAALKQINAVNIKAAIDSAVYWLKVFEYPHLSK